MTQTYPAIDLAEFDKFEIIIENAIADQAYLDPATCPYDEGVIDKIRKLVGWVAPILRHQTKETETKNPVGRPSNKVVLPIDEVEEEMSEIRKEISQMKLDAKGLETADRIQIIKTRTALVEKIIGMKERTSNIKKQQQFIATVIGIMDDVMDQKQREEMIRKLEPFTNE